MTLKDLDHSLTDLGRKNEHFEEALELFTTGSPEISLKEVDERFRVLKKAMKKVRAQAKALKESQK